HRTHLQRSARYRGDAARALRMHRGGDREYHRTLAARRALDPRSALPAPRSGAGRERHRQARKANKPSQLPSQLAGVVGIENREKPRRMKDMRTLRESPAI